MFLFVTSQITKAIDRLREELIAASAETLKQQNKSEDAAKERHNEARNVQPPWLENIVSRYQQTVGDQAAEGNKQYSVQNSIRKATWCAFFAAIFYGGVAFIQMRAMQESNKINRESLESVQRAFVSYQSLLINEVTANQPNGPVKTLVMNAIWNNSGTTPALQVIQFFKADVLNREPSEPEFAGDNYHLSLPKATIAAKGSSQSAPQFISENLIVSDMNLGPNQTIRSVRPAAGVAVWGWAVYRDIFARTPTHLAEFCQQMQQIRLPTDPKQAPVMDFSACQQHNCEDEYCADYSEMIKKLTK